MLSDRELATVLTALRHWQESHDGRLTNDALREIATDGGKFEALDFEEIQRLCQLLNAGEPGLLDTQFIAMCRQVAETAENWADCSDLREVASILRELGLDCRRLLESAREDRTRQRYVLYDFDAGQLVTTRVYDSYGEVKEDAEQLPNVLIVPLAVAIRRSPDVDGDEAAKSCDCEQPGYFSCGVPGILAHFENGRLAPGSKVERCDQCQRYPTDAAALARLKELGLA